ncbi:DUF5689 domain-containing protein [uncultured Tenacibaculum sp.]|uniref:DUF5689 domain-containing protein n=1 Tax=uncultured Tenacibaculum sp. TaxID=174713 RepID=UPI0026250006|nr:DUF5689 domain-containing protein [uncultured Tenacibaculum sp.]
MKINSIKIITVILVTLLLSSCVDDNFDVPTPSGNEENRELSIILGNIANDVTWNLVTIADLKSRYNSGDAPLLIESNDVVKGYVVSSDRSGNFFQEIYIQDAAENPTTGIKVVLNLRNNYTKYNVGREVYVYLNGLYLGETNSGDGITTIGGKVDADDNNEVDVISENQLDDHLFRSPVTETIVPKTIEVSAINSDLVGTFVRIEDAFFPTALDGLTIVDPNEDFDTQRTLSACNGFGFSDFILETSSFSNFSSVKMQSQTGGTIDGIVTKDFGGDNFVIVINDIEDIRFEDSLCQPLDLSTFTPIFEEDFETTTGTGPITLAGWTNYIEAGSRSFTGYTDGDTNSRATRIGSFRSNDASSISWLITPAIDLDATANEFFSFENSNSFADGSELEILISTDWDGTEANVTSATWEALPAAVVSDGEFFRNWVSSGDVDLSAYSGSVYIAFKYIGSGDAGSDGTFEIDNVKVLAQ